MRIFILLLSCCFFIFQHFSYSYANTGEIDLHTQMNAVGDALNHQDFTVATVLKDEILKQISVEEIAKTSNYNDFLMYLQLLIWNGDTVEKNSIIKLRVKYHPEDIRKASLLTRKDRSAYWDSDCTSQHLDAIDIIDYAHCIRNSSKIDSAKKKKILFLLIPRYFSKVMKANDYQGMSDLSILLAYYASEYPEKSLLVEKYQRQLAEKILEYDIHWVNAYFIMISISKNDSEKSYWMDQLRKNYIGDDERRKVIVEPYINSYQK